MILLVVALGGGAALAQTVEPEAAAAPAANPDPFERTNRAVYRFNRGLDRALLRPPAVFYKHATPRPLRTGLHHFFQNLGEPVTFVNDVLQLHPSAAGRTLGRFALNSTAGIGGFFDVGTGRGLPYRVNNFGYTLGRYGAPQGPYIVLPILGPSSVRDASGRVVDLFADPFTYFPHHHRTEVFAVRSGLGGLDARASVDPVLKALDATATDPYATLRAAYLQNSQAAATGGRIDVDALPDFAPTSRGPGGPSPATADPRAGPFDAAPSAPDAPAAPAPANP